MWPSKWNHLHLSCDELNVCVYCGLHSQPLQQWRMVVVKWTRKEGEVVAK